MFTGFGFGVQGVYVAVVSEVLPRALRPLAQTIFNIASSTGGVMGIAAGGLYIKYDVVGAGWRMIYGTLAILCRLAPPLTSFREEKHSRFCSPDGLSCLTILFLYRPAQKRPDVSAVFHNHRYKIMAIDPVGVLLLACGVCPLYYGLVSALNPYKWSDAHVLGPLCAGLAGFACFGLWGTCCPTCPHRASAPLTDPTSPAEWKGNSEGLLHHALFSRSRNYALSVALLFTEG